MKNTQNIIFRKLYENEEQFTTYSNENYTSDIVHLIEDIDL